jgi:hypothetical protein
MPNVIMLSVILLNVVAPNEPVLEMGFFRWPFWQKTAQNPTHHIIEKKSNTVVHKLDKLSFKL